MESVGCCSVSVCDRVSRLMRSVQAEIRASGAGDGHASLGAGVDYGRRVRESGVIIGYACRVRASSAGVGYERRVQGSGAEVGYMC